MYDGLVAGYPFCGDGSDILGDHDATVDGAILTTDRFGTENAAYSFDYNAHIFIEDGLINNGENYSISIWAKPENSQQTAQTLFNSIPHVGFSLTYNYQGSQSIGSYIGGASSGWDITNSYGPNIPINEWYHMILVKEYGQYRIYKDNSLYHSFSNDTDYNEDCGIRIGSIGTNGDAETFIGKLDDVFIWNRALTDLEIETLYNEEFCLISGCTDPTAFNYDENANEDDGSCIDIEDESTEATIIGDVNCDDVITIDDIQLLSNIWNDLVDPDTLDFTMSTKLFWYNKRIYRSITRNSRCFI